MTEVLALTLTVTVLAVVVFWQTKPWLRPPSDFAGVGEVVLAVDLSAFTAAFRQAGISAAMLGNQLREEQALWRLTAVTPPEMFTRAVTEVNRREEIFRHAWVTTTQRFPDGMTPRLAAIESVERDITMGACL